MLMPAAERSKLGQTSIEYLLLLAVVAVIVIASFRQGSLITQVHDSAAGYYNSVTQVIMGKNPSPINGGWCPVTCPSGTGPATLFGSCECPAPAFGGTPCSGSGAGGSATTTETCGAGQTCPGAFQVECSGVTSCSCPTGQICNSSGQCVCGDGLVCCDSNNQPPGCSGPAGSVTNTQCTQCICPNGTQYQGPAPGTCSPICGQVCTVWNGSACVPETCPGNQYCDTTPGQGYGLCQCIAGTYWNGVICTPYCTQACTSWNGSACVPTVCQPPSAGLYCNPQDGQCECPAPYICWNGSKCVLPSGNGTCNCTPQVPCPSSNGCSTDSCGNQCGSCPSPEVCSSNTSGTPGTCSGSTGCQPGTCVVSAPCGSNLGIDSNCGTVCVGQANQCPVSQQGQQENCNFGQCICGTCTPIWPCGSSAGFDSCGNSCTVTPGVCPTGDECSGSNTCVCAPNGTCTPIWPCGSSAGYDNCGNPCTAVPGTCQTGQICDAGNTCVCQSNGICMPIWPCGSSAGFDNCGNSCTAVPGTCPSGQTCNAGNTCSCQSNGICMPIWPCGSSAGFDNCGNSCVAVPGTCPVGQSCSNNTCINCTPDGSCTAPCGSTSGTDNCGEPCTTSQPGTTCPVGETCTAGTCVCTTPGICPAGAVCGPDTCGNANGCNGPNACPTGESCTNGVCMPNCLACQTWNGSSCVTTVPCGTDQCGYDGCGNVCGPDNGNCPTGQNCSSGQCVPTCLTCQTWNGTACVTTIPCGNDQCGADSCGNACGPDNGLCPQGELCTAGQCVSDCLACQTWTGTSCVTTTPCGNSECGTDSCGNECGSDNGLCPTGQTCATGQCVDCPNCAGAACGASDGCGGTCLTGTCSSGTCSAGQCLTTFTLDVLDFADCNSCAALCPILDLGGGCGRTSDCGSSCGINYSNCTQDPTDGAWSCGSCLQETLVGTGCVDGIASIISQTVGNPGSPGNCSTGSPGTASTVTYQVICNP